MIGDLTPCSFVGRSLSGEKKRCIGGKEVHINKKIVGKDFGKPKQDQWNGKESRERGKEALKRAVSQ